MARQLTTFLSEVVVDCADPVALGRFYAGLCGCELHQDDGDEDWTWIEPRPRGGAADVGGTHIAFQRVPEPKVGKVRLHIDLGATDVDASVAFAVTLGAARLQDPVTDGSGTFVVMSDPEGHEFCIVDA